MTWLFRYWRDSDKKQLNPLPIRLGLILFLLALLAGCDDSGGSVQQTTGRFIDAPVQGLAYTCSSGGSGATNTNGEYTCPAGDDVTFSLGGQDIGTVAAQSTFLTPYSLFPNNLYAALNLARLLQTIDTDGDPDNGNIIIDPGLTLPTRIDYTSLTYEQDTEAALGIDLISASDAQNRLNAAILDEGGTVPAGANIPVANAGPDQTVSVGATVQLDGSGSSDADGDSLTYQWSLISSPAGTTTTLSGASAVNPTFVADVAGDYVAQLVVNDGTADSAADTVRISTSSTDNTPPTANAGPDQSVSVGATVQLDGSGSSDADGDSLTYQWSITSEPAGSAAALSDATAANPTFTADVAGNYVAQLIVNDGATDSAADTVKISASTTTTNTPPTANAGSDQSVSVGATVQLDGNGSSDADGDTLTYQWNLTSKPAGSTATLSDASAANPTFGADMDGDYVARLIVNDGNANSAADTVQVSATDTLPPSITADNPTDGATITDVTQTMVYDAADDYSGIDANTLTVRINNVDKSQLANYAAGKITITPDQANQWQVGVVNIVIELSDLAGNQGSGTFSYAVQPGTQALPVARPNSGFAPLTTTFYPFNTSGTAIERYEWDFDGDGSYDVSETVGRNQTRTYNAPGTYTVSLRLTDSEGAQTTGTIDVDVQNKPPVVSAQANPSNGSAPLDVTFSASAQDNEGVALYEWDFEGDGVYDQSGANATSASHTYDTQGEFQPVLRVTDTLGAQTTYALSDIEVRVNPEGYPTVTAQASPISGTTPLAVSFSATANAVGVRTISQWEWDFDGDDTFDFSSATSASTSHTYNAAGDFFAKVRVTDSDNQQSEDVIRISVSPALSLSVATDTIDTANGEAADISTTLGGDLMMSLIIEDRYGNPVRTLVPKGVRNAGNYTDSWAGDDDDGNTVSEGDYRAVIVYEVDGVEQRYDLSLSTGGTEYNPTRTAIPNNFQPFAGNPLVIDFTLNRASEVTAFMGRFNTNARLITFMQREPLGAGTHRIIWNGEDSTGQLIHPPAGDRFLFGLFGYTLPDNAIYVRSGAHIQDLTITPAILVPDSVTDSVSRLSFTLTNAADVRLTVYNADEGTLMTSKIITGLSAGANEVTWDGKNNQGIYVTPGKYRLGLTAIDNTGYQSITRYVVQQVYY